jgi:hypothetical protein
MIFFDFLKALNKTGTEDTSTLRERLTKITAALEKIKLEKIMLEEKLNEVQAFSPCRTSLKDVEKDQATQAPTFCRTSPSSLDMSEWGKSPVNSIETVVQLNLSQSSLPGRHIYICGYLSVTDCRVQRTIHLLKE